MGDVPKQFDADGRTREFMRLLVSNQRRIHAFVLSLVPHKSDSEDIMQDTLTEMWKQFDKYEPDTSFAGWGIVIAKFKVLNFRRKTKKLQFSEELIERLQAESQRNLESRDSRFEALRECTKKLSPKERKLLRLRYEDDLTFRKIGSIFGYSHQAVCRAMSLIHARLVLCVRSRGVI